MINLGLANFGKGTATALDANYCGPVTVPPPMRDTPPLRRLRPLLFMNNMWVPLRPTELMCNGCETGPTVYRHYAKRLQSLTVCRCH